MSAEQWIEMVGWEKFQHYRDRRPLWIKNYTELLTKREYRALSAAERGVLHNLWMIYAVSGGEIPFDPGLVNRWCGFRSKMDQLEALQTQGFIRRSASKPLAQRERKKEKKKRSDSKSEPELLTFDQYLSTVAKAQT